MRFCRFIMLFGIVLFSKADAQLTVTSLLSDHAVIQRRMPIHVFGTGPTGVRVRVGLKAQSAETSVDNSGFWELWLRSEEAGGPYELRVRSAQSSEEVVRKDILVGDVWFASGQSNMEFPLKGWTNAPLKNGPEEISRSTHPSIRLFLQKQRSSPVVLLDTDDIWTQCTTEHAKEFSAVGYFFAREIEESQKIPIGIIDATWGGTPIRAWMSYGGLAEARVPPVFEEAARYASTRGNALEQEQRQGKVRTDYLTVPPSEGSELASLYNDMVAPFTQIAIKGVIWYQGEADASVVHAVLYPQLFPALVNDWRKHWQQGSLPFLFVQLSSYGSDDDAWGKLRNAQRSALSLRDTAMAISLDIGEPKNIHPGNKQEVGHRLALLARKSVYNESVSEAYSPDIGEARLEEHSLRLTLEHADNLHFSEGARSDFEIAGSDHKFFPADAHVEGETILLTSTSVAMPRFARYGWKGTVSVYVLNGAGLPLGTFSTSD